MAIHSQLLCKERRLQRSRSNGLKVAICMMSTSVDDQAIRKWLIAYLTAHPGPDAALFSFGAGGLCLLFDKSTEV
jgi:hypothetical protein